MRTLYSPPTPSHFRVFLKQSIAPLYTGLAIDCVCSLTFTVSAAAGAGAGRGGTASVCRQGALARVKGSAPSYMRVLTEGVPHRDHRHAAYRARRAVLDKLVQRRRHRWGCGEPGGELRLVGGHLQQVCVDALVNSMQHCRAGLRAGWVRRSRL